MTSATSNLGLPVPNNPSGLACDIVVNSDGDPTFTIDPETFPLGGKSFNIGDTALFTDPSIVSTNTATVTVASLRSASNYVHRGIGYKCYLTESRAYSETYLLCLEVDDAAGGEDRSFKVDLDTNLTTDGDITAAGTADVGGLVIDQFNGIQVKDVLGNKRNLITFGNNDTTGGPLNVSNFYENDENDMVIHSKGAVVIDSVSGGQSVLKFIDDGFADNYSSISTSAQAGSMIIKTHDSSLENGDITLDADGDIELNADGGDIVFKDDSATLATVNGDGLTINNITGDSAGDNYLVEVSGLVKKRTPAETLSDIGAQASLTFGISDTNVAKCGAGIVDNDFIRVDGTTFEGRSASEVLSDIGAQAAGSYAALAGAAGQNFSANDLTVAGDITIDDGGSIKEAGGTAAITIDADGEVTKIGQDSPSDGQVLTWDNGNSKVVWSASGGGGGGISTAKAIAMAMVFG
jgi:hypothetical protein